MHVAVSLTIMAALLGQTADAQESRLRVRTVIDQSASAYTFYSDLERSQPMKLIPVLRWTNNVRGSEEGATFLWVEDGRPEAAVCVYPWSGLLCDNFQSLSKNSIFAERDGKRVWSPSGPGVIFRSVPGASSPAESGAVRLRHMKSLAGDFSVTLVAWAADNSDHEELRLLTRPVYRYETTDDALFDGAVFAFVQGTDPEAFLVIEAARFDNAYRWEYAFARRTSGAMKASYRDHLVWDVPKEGDWTDPKKTHFQLTRPFDVSRSDTKEKP